MRQIQACRLHVHLLLLPELPRTSLLLDAGAVADVDELEAAGRGGILWDTWDESLPASASVAKPAGLELSAPLMLPPSLSSGFHVLLHLQPREFHQNLELLDDLCGVLFSDPLPEVLVHLIAGRVFNRDGWINGVAPGQKIIHCIDNRRAPAQLAGASTGSRQRW